VICDAWSVVVVPFPFSASPQMKSRPAVVLSGIGFNRGGLSVMAMITSARHTRMRGDIPIKAGTAGLPKDCLIRMKLFTLDNRLIRNRLGVLPPAASRLLVAQLRSILRLR
jgi:mRNA interferase MazF